MGEEQALRCKMLDVQITVRTEIAFAELGTLSIKGDATESQNRTVKKFFQK